MRTGATLSVYNTMVSSHQLYSWDHGPLYLSMQHHGLFSPIPYMRPGPTLSAYTTPWSHVWDCWEETMMLYRQIEWSMVSWIELERRDQGPLSVNTTSWSLLTNSIHQTMDHSICLYNIIVSSHQSHTWEQGPLYLFIQDHGLFSPTLFIVA
jgi:hypothetical protein